MAEKAYKSGSSFPELKKDTLRIYSSRICPFAERALLVLAHKNIQHEVVNINLKDKPEWFLAKTPVAKVPVIEHNDIILYESTAVSEYLDDVFPGDKLQSLDPFRKAMDRILLEQFGQLTSAFHPIFLNIGNEEKRDVVEETVDKILKVFHFYDEQLAERGSQFFGGATPGMIDFLIFPHFERIPSIATYVPRAALSKSDFPILAGWWDAMAEVPAVKKEMHDADWHLEIFKLLREGKPAGDYGLDE